MSRNAMVRRTLDRVNRRLRQRLRGEVDIDRLVAQGLELGRGTYIGRGVFIDAGHPWLISIGDESVLTAGAIVLAHDGSTRLHAGCTRIARVRIGNRVFVGAGSVILPGSTIGDGSIVGALTVVRGEVPPRSIVIGNPGKVVSGVDSFAARHREAAAAGPAWPYRGWMAGHGVTEAAKRAQREALSGGRSGYLCGALSAPLDADGEPRA
jgi:maltose O-acetyltransferase